MSNEKNCNDCRKLGKPCPGTPSGKAPLCFRVIIKAPRPEDSSGSNEFALLGARKLKAFDWLDANADELSMEWTGTHNHIYSGNEENLERLGCGRSLLEAIENCMGI